MFLLNLVMLITGYIWWGVIVLGGVAYLGVAAWHWFTDQGTNPVDYLTQKTGSAPDAGLTLFDVPYEDAPYHYKDGVVTRPDGYEFNVGGPIEPKKNP